MKQTGHNSFVFSILGLNVFLMLYASKPKAIAFYKDLFKEMKKML